MKFKVPLLAVNKMCNIPLCCLGIFGGDIMTVLDFLQGSWSASFSSIDNPLLASEDRTRKRHRFYPQWAPEMCISVGVLSV